MQWFRIMVIQDRKGSTGAEETQANKTLRVLKMLRGCFGIEYDNGELSKKYPLVSKRYGGI